MKWLQETAYYQFNDKKHFMLIGYTASFDSNLKDLKRIKLVFIFQTHFDSTKYKLLYRR